MINYKVLRLGQLETNCYLVWERSKDCLIIDPADESTEITEEIRMRGLIPKGIVATHGHFDHVLAALDLKLIYQIPFYCSSRDKFLLDRVGETAEYFLKRKIKMPKLKIDKDLERLGAIKIGEEKLEIIKTPGHTPGSICLYDKAAKILFSGDTIFKGSVGRTDFAYGSEEKLEKSLKMIGGLEEETVILPGHGKETTIGEERINLGAGK